jgi:hypothetical protein
MIEWGMGDGECGMRNGNGEWVLRVIGAPETGKNMGVSAQKLGLCSSGSVAEVVGRVVVARLALLSERVELLARGEIVGVCRNSESPGGNVLSRTTVYGCGCNRSAASEQKATKLTKDTESDGVHFACFVSDCNSARLAAGVRIAVVRARFELTYTIKVA